MKAISKDIVELIIHCYFKEKKHQVEICKFLNLKKEVVSRIVNTEIKKRKRALDRRLLKNKVRNIFTKGGDNRDCVIAEKLKISIGLTSTLINEILKEGVV